MLSGGEVLGLIGGVFLFIGIVGWAINIKTKFDDIDSGD